MTVEPEFFTQGQLAGITNHESGINFFPNTGKYASQLSHSHQIIEKKLQEEGLHRRCSLIVLGILALLAIAVASWFLAAQGSAAWKTSGILLSLSALLTCWIVFSTLRSWKKEKKLMAGFEKESNQAVPLSLAVKAMDLMPLKDNQHILKQVEPQRLKGLIEQLFLDEATLQSSTGTLVALIDDPQLFQHIEKDKQRDIAVCLLQHLDSTSLSFELKSKLVRMVGPPQNEQEGLMLSQNVTILERYLSSMPRRDDQINFKKAFLNFATQRTPQDAMKLMLFTPTNQQEALLLARHPEIIQSQFKEQDRNFCVALLQWLPNDENPHLLEPLILHLGNQILHPDLNILSKHPLTTQSLIDNEKIPIYDRNYSITPDTLIEMPWSPEVISSILLKMLIGDQISFFKQLTDLYVIKAHDEQKAIARHAIHAIFRSKTFVMNYHHSEEIVFPKLKELILEISRWPEEVVAALSMTDLNHATPLLQYPLFYFLFFKSISECNGSDSNFSDAIVSSIFPKMSLGNKITFLNKMTDFYAQNPFSENLKRTAKRTIEEMVCINFISRFDQYATIPLALTEDDKTLLIQIGRWPEEMGDVLYVNHIENPETFLKHPTFFSFLINHMEKKDKEAMFASAAKKLQEVPLCDSHYDSWLYKVLADPIYSSFRPLMGMAPEQLAELACHPKTNRYQEKIAEIVEIMQPEQKKIYDDYYQIYGWFYTEYIDSSRDQCLSKPLFKAIQFMIDHPQWVQGNPGMAKKYGELLVISNLFPELQNMFSEKYPHLLDCFTVNFGTQTIKVPTLRLASLGQFFEKSFDEPMQESQEKKIQLNMDAYEIDESTAYSFLQFLASGKKPDFFQVDTIGLTILSEEYQTLELLHLCNLSLKNSIDEENFEDLLAYAIKYQLTALQWICYDYMKKNVNTNQKLRDIRKKLPIHSPEQQAIQLSPFSRGWKIEDFEKSRQIKQKGKHPYFSFE